MNMWDPILKMTEKNNRVTREAKNKVKKKCITLKDHDGENFKIEIMPPKGISCREFKCDKHSDGYLGVVTQGLWWNKK